MTIPDGGFAFPRKLPDLKAEPDEAFRIITQHAGMTLRDYFAGQAMSGYVHMTPAVWTSDSARK